MICDRCGEMAKVFITEAMGNCVRPASELSKKKTGSNLGEAGPKA